MLLTEVEILLPFEPSPGQRDSLCWMAPQAMQMPPRGWCVLEIDSLFEQVVVNNQGWLLRYVKKIVGSQEAAEDIVQETFIRAFKAYDGYQETGRQRQWLRTIARNVAFRYLGSPAAIREVNLCTGDESIVHFIETAMDPVPSAEEVALANELTRRIMEAISKLPEAQRSVVYYRFVRDFSVHQVAHLTNQPVGSVKSKCHYGLQKLRRHLSRYVVEGGFVVNCKDAYAFLFQYAKGRIMPEDREKVEGHLAACKDCTDLAESLRILAANMTPARDGEIRHYLIAIPLSDGTTLNYFGGTSRVDDRELQRINAILEANGGVIPRGENWAFGVHDADLEHLSEFDNEGHRIEFELVPNPRDPSKVKVIYRKMVKLYPEHLTASVALTRDKYVTTTIEDPNLVVGKLQNHLGVNAKSGLYLAIPAGAKNIRIKRGNGVIDAGAYKFAFSERYVAEDECLRLECTYLKS